jgi:hypothetical protein
MTRAIIPIIIFFQLILDNDFQKIFGTDYYDAIQYFRKNKLLIENQFQYYQVDKEIIVPVLFPERVRYSMVRDLLETIAVEQVYINYGEDYVDFSIGDFQLKPTFAAKVENYILNSVHLQKKYALLTKYEKTEHKEIRKERVKRLKQLKYQLIYISAFYDIVSAKFDLSDKTKTGKIAFYATAFNYGFLSPRPEIEAQLNEPYFPYGSKYRGKQYAYSEVSIFFYQKHYSAIF